MPGKGEHNLFWINTYISSRISSKGGFITLLFLESRASKWSKPEVSSCIRYGVILENKHSHYLRIMEEWRGKGGHFSFWRDTGLIWELFLQV